MSYFGEDVPKLGFGLMRLPTVGDKIDVEQVKKMVDAFLGAGFRYFDTAWAYPGSEDAIREALIERHERSSFYLATKNAAWIHCKTREDAIAQFETSLARTHAGYFDFYLLHNLGNERTEIFEKFHMWDFVKEKKAQGLIRHVGFSFHSTPEELDEILTKHPEAEFVQLQINYADWDNPAVKSRECYEVARKHGKSVVIMEPVKGGLLANPPKPVAEVLRAADPNVSYASWAIRFAASLDGVITVLSGMSNEAQMADNIRNMEHFTPLSAEEKKVIGKAQVALKSIPIIPCTSCNYCAKVCPNSIGISGSFSGYNHYRLYGNLDSALDQLHWRVEEQGKKPAVECLHCGACEKVCPQHIEIRKELEKVAQTFNEKKA
jgi:predicted aldo/keto reductase-like oxidoreductase